MTLKRLNCLLVVLVSFAFLPVSGQTTPASLNSAFMPVPFGPGERMIYKVELGMFGKVGHAAIQVEGIDSVHGYPTYRLRMDLEGGITFAHVDDTYQSWLDVRSLIARRFITDVKEVRYKRKRALEFFPDERVWRRTDKDESGEMPTPEPLDDLSFLFFVRTLPLEVGQTYTFNRYWKNEGNPVRVKVLRKQTIKTTSGVFETIVVQPIIRTKGLFGEGGKAEVYFTDDDRRIPVLIKSSVKVIGAMNLHLERYEPGARVSPPFRSRVAQGQ